MLLKLPMTIYKAIIADDEEHLRSYLKSRLTDVWPELEICGEACNGYEAIGLIEAHHPQIAFLDIKMPGLSGMEVAHKINHQCKIVFITAYDQYAVEAFEKEAIDYILKPITNERLAVCINRLKKEIDIPSDNNKVLAALEQISGSLPTDKAQGHLDWIRAQKGEDIRIIPIDDVSYFKSEDKYTVVYTRKEELLIKKPIKQLVKELSPTKFWRVNRGTIINVSCIDRVNRSLTGRYIVKLKAPAEIITVSKSYTYRFKQM